MWDRAWFCRGWRRGRRRGRGGRWCGTIRGGARSFRRARWGDNSRRGGEDETARLVRLHTFQAGKEDNQFMSVISSVFGEHRRTSK